MAARIESATFAATIVAITLLLAYAGLYVVFGAVGAVCVLLLTAGLAVVVRMSYATSQPVAVYAVAGWESDATRDTPMDCYYTVLPADDGIIVTTVPPMWSSPVLAIADLPAGYQHVQAPPSVVAKRVRAPRKPATKATTPRVKAAPRVAAKATTPVKSSPRKPRTRKPSPE